MTMRVLLTGASGFVGSHMLRHLMISTDWDVVCPITFRHKGLPARIESAVCGQPWENRVTIVHWDMTHYADALVRRKIGPIDVIMNVASESHVDRSIETPVPFIESNVALVLRVLELARTLRPKLFLQMSTDEVYGPAAVGDDHREWSPVLPSNPYSASKAAQEAVAISYWRTYGVPLVITNTMNIIGEMQDPEKFVPKIIRNLSRGEPVPVHVRADGKPGSRMYLHARNLADAWLFLTRLYTGEYETGTLAGHGPVRSGPPMFPAAQRPARFNVVGEQEIDNAEMVHLIGSILRMDCREAESLIDRVDFHGARPGHDPRYALNGEKIAELGWRAPVDLWKSLEQTVRWTLDHPEWLEL